MIDKSQELAISLPEEAKENVALDPAVENGLAKPLGAETRSKVEEALETPVAEAVHAKNEKADENPILAIYRQQYDRLSDDTKLRCSWEAVVDRLLANGDERLKRAEAMQGGGELVGIDSEGKAMFKDKGVEPVMYGFDKEGKLIRIYDREPEQMGKVEKWADYYKVREQVLKDGYELFAGGRNFVFSDEMKQVNKHAKQPFVASKDRKEWRASWLESGDKPDLAQFVAFSPNESHRRGISRMHVSLFPTYRGTNGEGAVRLLRV
jgi:hypothetical protein